MVVYEDNLIRMTFLNRKSWRFTNFWCLFWLLLHKEWLKIQAWKAAENKMKFLVSQLFDICVSESRLLCCSCWCRGFAVCVFSVNSTYPSAQSRTDTRTLSFLRGTRGEERSRAHLCPAVPSASRVTLLKTTEVFKSTGIVYHVSSGEFAGMTNHFKCNQFIF